MAKKTAKRASAQNVATPAFTATTEQPSKAKTQKLQRILASRMHAVERLNKMTPKMQRGFDRFNANIANAKENYNL